MMLTKLKPAVDGSIVAVPGSDMPLAAKGQTVSLNTYWRRRIKDKSVVIVDEEATKADKATAKKKDNQS